MAETINGAKAVVWGLSTSATGTGMGTFEAQSANFDAEADEVEVRNSKGQVVTDIFYNQRHILRMEVVPSSTTLAFAKTNSVLPQPGAIITVTDTDDTELTATNVAKYIFVRGSKAKSNTAETKLTFEMKQYVENDVAVTIAA
jgi:hypothetical protein